MPVGSLVGELVRGLSPASYIVFKDASGRVYAKNGSTGMIEYSDADASKVIQYALNMLANLGGGRLFIKGGTYTITNYITVPDNVVIEGEYTATKLIKPPENIKSELGYGKIFDVSNRSNVVIRDLYIESSSQGVDDAGYSTILSYKSKYVALERIYLKQRDDYGVVSGQSARGVSFVDTIHYVVRNSKFIGTGVEFHGNWGLGLGGKYGIIDGNYFEGWGHNAIMGAPNEGIIVNNVFYNNYDDAIDPNANYNFIVANNYFYADVKGAMYSVSLENQCYDVVIANNIVDGCAIAGIEVANSWHVTIVGNIFRCVKYTPIIVQQEDPNQPAPYDVVIVGNYFRSTEYLRGAIELNVKASRVLIEGNISYVAYNSGFVKIHDNTSVSDIIVRNNMAYSTQPWYNAPSVKFIMVGSGVNINNFIVEGNWLNTVTTDIVSGIIYRRNRGVNTNILMENSGIATIPAGQTRVTVSHGLATTPTKFQITPLGQPPGKLWVENITSTSFDIVTDTAPASDLKVSWYAEV